MKVTDENVRKDILSQMGLTDGLVDLDVYTQSLSQDISKIMNINKTLRKHIAEPDVLTSMQSNASEMKGLTEDIMSGLDF